MTANILEEMKNLNNTAPIRGAIRTLITNSAENIMAGSEFSIFVTIHNPFEVPLKLHNVSTHIPTEFIDVEQQAKYQLIEGFKNEMAQLQNIGAPLGVNTPPDLVVPPIKSKWGLRVAKVSLPFLSLEYSPNTNRSIARDIGDSENSISAAIKIPFISSVVMEKRIAMKQSDTEKEAIKERIQKDIRRYQDAIDNLQTSEVSYRDLQPGNSTTRVFTLRTRKRMWFKPATYRLQLEIAYEIAGSVNFDTIEHQIQIKASIASMVFGSLFGAIGGWSVKDLSHNTPDFSSLLRLLVSVVIAAMAVVLFARKKDVQPLIAIEDFWGGVALGFLAAYIGPKIFDTILPTGAPPVPGNG